MFDHLLIQLSDIDLRDEKERDGGCEMKFYHSSISPSTISPSTISLITQRLFVFKNVKL